jgi:hypothetical protein
MTYIQKFSFLFDGGKETAVEARYVEFGANLIR